MTPSTLFEDSETSDCKSLVSALIDYNDGEPVATCKYNGQLFFTSPLKCRLAKKPVNPTEKQLSKWEERVCTAMTKAVRKCFEGSIYTDVNIKVKNIRHEAPSALELKQ